MALSKIDTPALVADAVDNTILDVADDFAFTGTVTGAGGTPGLVHLSTQTLASDASEVAFNSLIDTSANTNYKIYAQGLNDTDGAVLRAVFRDSSDTDITGTNYYRGRDLIGSAAGNDPFMHFTPAIGANGTTNVEIGFALEINLSLINQAANNSIMPHMYGNCTYVATNGDPSHGSFGWIMRPDIVTTDVAGIRFYPSSGNFKAGSKFVLYGLAES